MPVLPAELGRSGLVRGAVPALVAAVVLVLDQASKVGVSGWLGSGAGPRRWELLGKYLALEYVENTGAAFGLLRGQGTLITAVALALLAAVVAVYWLLAPPSPELSVGLGLVVGGALGNLLDRVRLGYVVDFVAVGVWPKFNLADSAIALGVLALAWRAMAGSDDEPADRGEGGERALVPGDGRPRGGASAGG